MAGGLCAAACGVGALLDVGRAVDVRLKGPMSWVNSDGIFLTGADNHTVVYGAVSYSNDTISISLGDSKADFEGLEHPRSGVQIDPTFLKRRNAELA